jgi:hypothetical protein
VVQIFHLTLRGIARHTDVVMRTNQKTGALARQKFANRFDFFCTCLLFSDHVIQTEDHHGIGVAKNLLAEWQSLAGLI